jgi:hypothetical protein
MSVTVALITSLLLQIYLIAAPGSLFLCAVMFSAWQLGRTALRAGAKHLENLKIPRHSFWISCLKNGV